MNSTDRARVPGPAKRKAALMGLPPSFVHHTARPRRMKDDKPIKAEPNSRQRPLLKSKRGIGEATRWETGKRYVRSLLGRMALRLGYEYQVILLVLKRVQSPLK